MIRTLLTLVFAVCPLTMASSVELGEDGLHKQPWFTVTFKDIGEDIRAAKEAGKRLAIVVEQRGCNYCKRLHETSFSDPNIVNYIKSHFMVVQYNMFGDEEVVDTDGKVLTEKTVVRRWGLAFTPTILFLPETADRSKTAGQSAVLLMPGAFGKNTTLHAFQWVHEKGYLGTEPFQKYHARKLLEQAPKK